MSNNEERGLHISNVQVETTGVNIKINLIADDGEQTSLICQNSCLRKLIELLIRANADAGITQSLQQSQPTQNTSYRTVIPSLHVEDLNFTKWDNGGAAIRIKTVEQEDLDLLFKPEQMRFLRDVTGHHFDGPLVPLAANTPETPETGVPVFPGQAAGERFRLTDKLNRSVDPTTVVTPIVERLANNALRVVGTGFFIGAEGIVATAKHVFMNPSTAESIEPARFVVGHMLPSGQIIWRPVVAYSMHQVADFAVCVIAPAREKSSGDPLQNAILRISIQDPDIGTEIATYAYPHSEHGPGQLQLFPRWYDGEVRATYPDGRDKRVLPGPCYETSMVLSGGASGGPVFGKDGKVLGINCTGYGEQPISFVSKAADLLDLELNDGIIQGQDKSANIRIRELAQVE